MCYGPNQIQNTMVKAMQCKEHLRSGFLSGSPIPLPMKIVKNSEHVYFIEGLRLTFNTLTQNIV